MKAKKQPGPARSCPVRPRGAARPPARPARFAISQTQRTPAATAIFRNLRGLLSPAPTSAAPRQRLAPKGGQLRVVRCRRRGGSAQGNSLQHTQNVNAKARKVTGLSQEKCRGKKEKGEPSYYFTVTHTYLIPTEKSLQVIFPPSSPFSC